MKTLHNSTQHLCPVELHSLCASFPNCKKGNQNYHPAQVVYVLFCLFSVKYSEKQKSEEMAVSCPRLFQKEMKSYLRDFGDKVLDQY